MKILILNGPNLNLLGSREVDIYGKVSFETYFESLKAQFPGMSIEYFQSNEEGILINQIQAAAAQFDGIILNAAGYTHTSVALADAIAAVDMPVIEVHISNIYGREAFRRHSYISPYCVGVIAGLGLRGYEMALHFFNRPSL